MKKYLTKPVIAALAVATIAGGLTPVWASNSTTTTSDTKVVMGNNDQEYTRYRLKDLVENDPNKLNLLMKTESDHLYVVVDEIDLDEKLNTLIEDDKWDKIYKDYYSDIYLEVRYDDQEGIVSLKKEIKNDLLYITGKVSADVDKVVVYTPSNGKIEVMNFVDRTFTVTIPTVISSTSQYVTVKAYDGDKLLETEKLRVNTGTVEEQDVIVHTSASFNKSKQEVKVLGVVKSSTDEVYVTYDGVKKKATLKKVWDETEAFSVEFNKEKATSKEALVEAYEDGVKVDSEKVEVTNIDTPADHPATFTIKGTAMLSPKYKSVTVKGTIESSTTVDKDDYKIYAIAPDGVKYEIKLKDGKKFEATLPFKNRSYSSKGVTIQVFEDDKLVAQTVIAHGVPANVIPAPKAPNHPVKIDEKKMKHKDWKHEEDEDDDDQGKGHGKGHEKKH